MKVTIAFDLNKTREISYQAAVLVFLRYLFNWEIWIKNLTPKLKK